MIPTMILLFVVGYLFIALEHKTRIDKSAVALLMAGAIWTVFSLLGNDPHIQHELVDQLGDTCEILVFLIGAMTIVDLIDSYVLFFFKFRIIQNYFHSYTLNCL